IAAVHHLLHQLLTGGTLPRAHHLPPAAQDRDRAATDRAAPGRRHRRGAAPRPAAQEPTGGGKRVPIRKVKEPGAAPAPAEATVTFVVREVRESRAPASDPASPARPDGAPEPPAAPFAAPESTAAEAEVIILTDDAERARREA